MKTNKIFGVSMALLCAVFVSCRENEFGTVDLTLPGDTWEDITAEYAYPHPCAMYNDADFARVKKMLDENTASPVVEEEFEALKSSRFTVVGYQPTPVEYMKRGTSADVNDDADEDAVAAYQTALLWKLTGEESYAETSVNILNAWADKCKGLDPSGNANQMLTAGIQGYTFANAAEIMQTYAGWQDKDISDFKKWMVDVWAVKNRQFMDYHWSKTNTTCKDHYWSNWDLVNMCSYLAIGILTENDEMVNYVVNYFYNGIGNGCIDNLVRGTHTDPLGTGETICQNQESGRDQGHSLMSVMVTANLCQMAYTFYQANKEVQALDFFSAKDNAVLKMAEYVALCNLKDGSDNKNLNGSWLVGAAKMPFTEFKYCVDCTCKDKNHSAIQTVVNLDEDHGRGEVRPGWEILYMHYARIKGLSNGYAYTKKFADKIRPECGPGDDRYLSVGGQYDQLGWGTLMLYQE